MPVTAIVGAQWGDEGKGKITDLLAQDADLVMRFGGGNNAGHTVVNDRGTYHLHAIPSGIFNPAAISLIGTGAVVDFDALGDELEQLSAGSVSADGLRISSRAQVVMPYHKMLDRLEDESRGSLTLATTRRGIGPAYTDKAARVGIQVGDLLCPDALRSKLEFVLPGKNRELERFGESPLRINELYERTGDWARRYGSLVVDQVALLADVLGSDRAILLEGQLGAMRDLDWGTYPYVTSSTTIAGGGAVGGGIPPGLIQQTVGVVKAYTTAVGTGPVPTELSGTEAEQLRERGEEYGVTTGRARRTGWFDAVAVRYARMLNQFSGIALTKLDVLDGMTRLKIATAYEIDGRRWDSVPITPRLDRALPVYEELPGWDVPASDARQWSDLPAAAQAYVERIEELVGARVSILSVGPARDQTIFR